ncbi:hypothetical protein CHU00_06595 [Sphingobacterium cellulitidis]|nr:hypothetical protein CHU00_06595 [Sphingobacterium cellulitidis]
MALIFCPVDYKNAMDIELWKSCQNGDPKAFDALFKRYYTSAYRYCLTFISNEPNAEELTMDVFFRIWKNAGTVESNSSFEGYLRRSIKNAVYNFRRSRLMDIVQIDEVTENEHPSANNVDQHLREAEMEELYEETVGSLSPRKQLVFRMSREENMTYAEISKKLDISVNVVEKYMVSSLSKCRTHLAEKLATLIISLMGIFLFF